MNISIGENSRNKKNPFEYIVPPPSRGSEQKNGRFKLLNNVFHKCDHIRDCGNTRDLYFSDPAVFKYFGVFLLRMTLVLTTIRPSQL